MLDGGWCVLKLTMWAQEEVPPTNKGDGNLNLLIRFKLEPFFDGLNSLSLLNSLEPVGSDGTFHKDSTNANPPSQAEIFESLDPLFCIIACSESSDSFISFQSPA